MSIFYPNDLIIYGLSVNSFVPFNVQDDVLAKVRKNFFEHNRRQNDKLVQNVQDISIRYTYNLEKNKPMKWTVQKNKRTIEDSVIVSVNSYEIRTYNDKGEKIAATEYSNEHIFKKITFSLNNETTVISSGKEENSPVLFVRSNSLNHTLNLLQINEEQEVLLRLRKINPYISVTAFTNLGLVYFGTEEEIKNIQNIVSSIKKDLISERTPAVYITEEDKKSGFNFKDNDFNLKRNMNETYNIDKSQYFSFESEVTDNSVEETPQNAEATNVEKVSEEKKEIVPHSNYEETKNSKTEVPFTNEAPPFELVEELVGNESIESYGETVEYSKQETTADLIDDIEEETPKINQQLSDKSEDLKKTDREEKNSTPVDNDLILKQVINAMLENGAKQQSVSEDEETPAESATEDNKEADLIINSGGERYLYFGQLNANLEREGYGRTEMSNGRTAYEGNYKSNKRDGFGSFYYKDGGLCYVGEWKENRREGFGVGIRSSDGSYHAGNWSDNKPEGIGVRFDKYGKFSCATNYKDGREDGLCVQFNDDGSISVFKWVNDSKKIIQRIYP